MKKILAMLLTVAMLLSLVIVATVSVAADDENAGMWTTWGSSEQYDADFSDDPSSVPGYEYSEDGLKVPAADWTTGTPFFTVQSKVKVDLKAGVYFEIRIDDFTYAASDKWFNLNIWDSEKIRPGSSDVKYGQGIQTLLRPASTGPVDDNAETTDKNERAGSVASIAWYTEAFTSVGGTAIDAANRTVAEVEGALKDVFTLEVSWDAANGTYAVSINKTPAPEKVITYMNEHFADGQAYIGFTTQNSQKGGTAAATVTKFGTSAATAAIPYGTDSKDAENYDNSFADFIDPATVPAGQPAVFMTGDKEATDLKNIPGSSVGAIVSVTETGSIKTVANGATADFGALRVDNTKSVDVKDFPVLLCVTKNWCSCKMDAHAYCLALESMSAYVMIGEDLKAAPSNKVAELDMCYDPVIIGEDNYLYFWVDLSELDKEGRFNGVRFDAGGVDLVTEGFNEFEMLWTGLFRDVDEAEAYALDYLDAIANPGGSTDDDTTVDSGADTTEADTSVDTTEADTATDTTEADTATDTTEADTSKETEEDTTKETEATTTQKAETTNKVEETKAETDAPAGDDAAADEGGCGSFVGFGAMAVVAVAAVAGMVSFKKKED